MGRHPYRMSTPAVASVVSLASLCVASCGDDDPSTDSTIASVSSVATTPPSSVSSTSAVDTVATSTSSTSPSDSTAAASTTAATTTIATTTIATTTTTSLPSQLVTIRDPIGNTIEVTGDSTIAVTERSKSFELEPTAVSTGLTVQIASVGPADVCQSDGPTGVFILGSAPIGAACDVRLQAPGTDTFAAADYVVSMTLTAAGIISWTYESGPPQQACFRPGDTVPDLVIRPTADSDPLEYQVDMIDPYVELPPGTSSELSRTVSLFLDHGDDGNSPVGRFEIAPDAPPGTRAGFTIGYSAQGTSIYVTDEPDRFDWTIEESCA